MSGGREAPWGAGGSEVEGTAETGPVGYVSGGNGCGNVGYGV